MEEGKIKWFNSEKGYGFIELSSGGSDVFVHITALEDIDPHSITEGMSVLFNITDVKGRSQAANVKKA